VAVSSSPLYDKLGFAIGVVLVVRDLREVTELRSRLVVSGRLAAVGELAAGIAHEINNPISYVRSNLGLLGAHWRTLAEELEKAGRADALADAIAEGDALLDESLDGIDRVAAIVRDVRGVSHAGGGEPGPVDLSPVLERVMRVVARRFDARIEMEIAAIPLVLGDAPELEQVFLNLVMNAGQAIRPAGRIRIAAAPQGTALEIAIEDDGVGIPPENLDRVFDPFFTTKPQGEGTGLGLAISYQIVRRHGGRISVASSPGGTIFRVRLPLAPASDAEHPVSSSA
jgi:two-component system NtrC family sensor kinase